jgi:hypothetical protein
MTPSTLAVALFVSLGAIALIFNHLQARLGLLEVVLNEGLPPGHRGSVTATSSARFESARAVQALGPGLHIFVSRGCHACQRLLEELDDRGLSSDADLHLRYVDRPRPAAETLATALPAHLHRDQLELAEGLGVDPLPHTVAVGSAGLVAHNATPTTALIAQTARDAGIRTTATRAVQ